MACIEKEIKVSDFQSYILHTYLLNPKEVDRILDNTASEDPDSFKRGFLFGLAWASLSASQVPERGLKEDYDS